MKRFFGRLTALLLAAACLAGCAAMAAEQPTDAASLQGEVLLERTVLTGAEFQAEALALAASPAAVPVSMTPTASGKAVERSDKAVIDYSNITDGYVMVSYTGTTTSRLKAQVKGPSGTTYTYDITAGEWEVFPLSDGNGSYKVTLYQNTAGTKYAAVLSAAFTVALRSEFAPFLLPNQYVDYTYATKTVAKAKELTGGLTDTLEQVEAVYNYVVTGLTYDKEKAATVKSGYLPVLDTVLAQKKGICFDYAALMAAMLRSQEIPCKLVVGYAGKAYHAWINVYSEETGWIDGAIYFDGVSWKLMDPTYASSGKQSKSIMEYIGDGSNYTAKYIY